MSLEQLPDTTTTAPDCENEGPAPTSLNDHEAAFNGASGPVDESNASIEEYRDLYERAPVGYVTLNSEGLILKANLTAADQIGVDRSSLPGTWLGQYLTRDCARHVREQLRGARETGGIIACDVELRTGPGEKRRYVQVQVAAAQGAAGDTQYRATLSTITARKESERDDRFLIGVSTQLIQSLDYHTTLAQLARVCVPYLGDWCTVFIVERDGRIQRLAMAHADPAKEQIAQVLQHRYPPGASNPFALPILRGEPVLVPRVDEDYVRSTTQNEEHLELVRALGPTSIMIVPLMARGRVLGAISLMSTGSHPAYTDKDLKLGMEVARRAALPLDNARLFLEAQEAIEARDEFLSIASHELRTPLTSLTLQLQSLVRSIRANGLQSLSEEPAARRLEAAQEQVQRMATLVGKLLDVTRISAGRVELDIGPVAVVPLVSEVVERFDSEIQVAGCTLTLRIEDYPVVRADPFRLDQVLTNLISNAIKYGRGSPVEVRVLSRDGVARLSVSDRGIGIAPEHHERIFERFERAGPGGHQSGLGLGLYISRQILHTMGGRIHVTSLPSRGATFTIELPLAQ